ILAEIRNCSWNYHKMMKIPLLKGRYFMEQDDGTHGNVCIVSQEFVERYFPNEEPLGQKIEYKDLVKEIVGVVGNVKKRSLSTKEITPFMYEPIEQTCWHTMTFLLRANQDPLSLANGVRQAVWDVDPNQPILRIRTMEQIIGEAISMERFTTILLSIMAGVALLMAVMGIYGVMSYTVSERTHEIGIRIALGAQVKDILILIVTKGMMLSGIGAAIGIFGAFALTQILQSLLYKVNATDLITFVLVTCILLIVSFLAAFLPARKAARTDPMNTLRCE
ncbi:FtsX-like permease family protein, partial [bacterium]|nr:FtsX-like permease family protein [bacterium]